MLVRTKRKKLFLSVMMVLLLGFGAVSCTTAQRNTSTGAAWGTGIGAALGAGIGALTGNAGLGAAIGAGAGFFGGALVGATMLENDDDIEKVKRLSGAYMDLDTLDNKLLWAGVSADGINAIMNEARALATQYPNARFGFGKDGGFRHIILSSYLEELPLPVG